MRGIRAKILRRVAEGLTVGEEAVRYGQHRQRGNIALDPRCTRAVYQQLKKRHHEQRTRRTVR